MAKPALLTLLIGACWAPQPAEPTRKLSPRELSASTTIPTLKANTPIGIAELEITESSVIITNEEAPEAERKEPETPMNTAQPMSVSTRLLKKSPPAPPFSVWTIETNVKLVGPQNETLRVLPYLLTRLEVIRESAANYFVMCRICKSKPHQVSRVEKSLVSRIDEPQQEQWLNDFLQLRWELLGRKSHRLCANWDQGLIKTLNDQYAFATAPTIVFGKNPQINDIINLDLPDLSGGCQITRGFFDPQAIAQD